ncbi:MAG: TIM barrel protein [Clostridiales bacterium]|nr:TIM barrel protein [Clostridiales bacterium]
MTSASKTRGGAGEISGLGMRPAGATAERGRLLFGTAGVPLSTPASTTLAAIEHVKKIGLDCLEVEFVKGVKMGSDTAEDIRKRADALDVRLSAHAPYYINLNSPEQGKRLASQERLTATCRMAEVCGATNVVFHGGYYGQSSPEGAYKTIKAGLQEILSILRAEKNSATLRIETMGRKAQFGSLDEVLFLCREVEGLLPCLDFAHIHTRKGGANSYRDFQRILKKVGKKLGEEAIKNLHIHISGALYGGKGEIKHLDLRDSDFHYDSWIRALEDCGAAGMVICESPNLEADALMLKNLYNSYRMKG